MRLKDKVALITGSGSGIGKESALLFAKEGAKIVVNDINEEGGKEVVRRIRENGGNAIFVKADVSRERDCKKMVDRTIKKYGRIDILFNNAGISKRVSIVDLKKEEWDRVIAINLTGVFLVSKYAIPHMIKQRRGVIINMASISGLMGSKNLAAYCASKGGVVLLTKAMACDLGEYNIRVNCICPCHTITPMVESALRKLPKKAIQSVTSRYPLGRFGKPEEIANLALFLASDESSFITGSAVIIDGGATANVVSLSEFTVGK